MRIVILLLFLSLGFSGFGQADLNDYKYIIVPKKFESFKEANEHQTSTLVKYLFTGKSFNVIYDDELPEDLVSSRCLGLLVDLVDDSSMFTTKTTITLEDCKGTIVFTTLQGLSKKKDYRMAYTETIRESMRSFNGYDYTYNGKAEQNVPLKISFKNDIKTVEDTTNKKSDALVTKGGEKEKSTGMVQQKATETEQYFKSTEPTPSTVKKSVSDAPVFKNLKITKPTTGMDMWYAQTTANGFQLVDSTPTIQMRLLKSSTDNIFIAQSDVKNGIVYQKNGTWMFEYYENDQLVQQELNIKF